MPKKPKKPSVKKQVYKGKQATIGTTTYVEVSKLTQKYLKHLKYLEKQLNLTKPKEGLPDSEWVATFTKITKLIIDLAREERHNRESTVFDNMSLEDLIEELKPVLINAGWVAPSALPDNEVVGVEPEVSIFGGE